jgi:hypothetical protein
MRLQHSIQAVWREPAGVTICEKPLSLQSYAHELAAKVAIISEVFFPPVKRAEKGTCGVVLFANLVAQPRDAVEFVLKIYVYLHSILLGKAPEFSVSAEDAVSYLVAPQDVYSYINGSLHVP